VLRPCYVRIEFNPGGPPEGITVNFIDDIEQHDGDQAAGNASDYAELVTILADSPDHPAGDVATASALVRSVGRKPSDLRADVKAMTRYMEIDAFGYDVAALRQAATSAWGTINRYAEQHKAKVATMQRKYHGNHRATLGDIQQNTRDIEAEMQAYRPEHDRLVAVHVEAQRQLDIAEAAMAEQADIRKKHPHLFISKPALAEVA
jgi:hypothetical protein